MSKRVITYRPSLTCLAFHRVTRGYEYKGIRGPVGSGKSVGCCWEIRLRSDDQHPLVTWEEGKKKRIRWTKWLIGRNTYPELVQTTIKTWLQWFPQTKMNTGSHPIYGVLDEPSMKRDGTVTRIELLFYALNTLNIENDLKSLELSGAWINEASQVKWDTITEVQSRIGRFQPLPGMDEETRKKMRSFGVIMDTNSPDEMNWWYKKEVVEKPAGMLFFIQPPALLRRKIASEDGGEKTFFVDNDGRDYDSKGILPAENVDNLQQGFYYYHKQTNNDPDKVKRLILNEFGLSVDGCPVYPEYVDSIHYKDVEFNVLGGMRVLMGSDFGRTPATVIAQVTPGGELRILDELFEKNMSAEQFIEERVRPLLVNKYGFPGIQVLNFADPAGSQHNEVTDQTVIQKWNDYGIKTIPAPGTNGNRTDVRIEAVKSLLRRISNGVAMLQISKNCQMLRAGFNGHYHYRRIRVFSDTGEERFSDEPDKNDFSHIHDAFQYLCLGVSCDSVDYTRAGGEDAWSRLQREGVHPGFQCDLL